MRSRTRERWWSTTRATGSRAQTRPSTARSATESSGSCTRSPPCAAVRSGWRSTTSSSSDLQSPWPRCSRPLTPRGSRPSFVSLPGGWSRAASSQPPIPMPSSVTTVRAGPPSAAGRKSAPWRLGIAHSVRRVEWGDPGARWRSWERPAGAVWRLSPTYSWKGATPPWRKTGLPFAAAPPADPARLQPRALQSLPFRQVPPLSCDCVMPLCFIEPQEAIRVVAETVGREARRQLLAEVVRAWVDDIPDDELAQHYAKAVEDLDEDDLSMLAAWHASLEVGQPIANKEFLLGAFPRLGEHRREALRIAAGFRGEDAFEAGISEDQALDTVLPWLSDGRLMELAAEAIDLYCWDRLGSDN